MPKVIALYCRGGLDLNADKVGVGVSENVDLSLIPVAPMVEFCRYVGTVGTLPVN